jgi:hypothetical protein
MGLPASVQVRYDHGMKSIFKETDTGLTVDSKNRSFVLLLGLAF